MPVVLSMLTACSRGGFAGLTSFVWNNCGFLVAEAFGKSSASNVGARVHMWSGTDVRGRAGLRLNTVT